MDKISSLNISQVYASLNNNRLIQGEQSENLEAFVRGFAREIYSTGEASAVPLNNDIPTTSQVDDVRNSPDQRTDPINDADNQRRTSQEEARQQEARQAQIETALSEITGRSREEFQNIDLEAALALQERFRNRSTDTGGNSTTTFSNTNNNGPDPQVQARLQARLADQLATDPGTPFPQIIDTTA